MYITKLNRHKSDHVVIFLSMSQCNSLHQHLFHIKHNTRMHFSKIPEPHKQHQIKATKNES